MEHLACFVPGMLALGAFNADGTPLEGAKWTHLVHAKALAYVAPIPVFAESCSRSMDRPACVVVLFRLQLLYVLPPPYRRYSCWQMYERTATGLSPDMIRSNGLSDPVPDGGVRTARLPRVGWLHLRARACSQQPVS
jgi:hypothetical protein